MALADDSIGYLRAKKNSATCADVRKALKSLDFSITTSRSKPGHHIATHAKLAPMGFHAVGFNCDHSGVVKLPYILQIIKVIEMYKDYF